MGIVLNQVTERYFAILEDYFGEALKVAAKYHFSTPEYMGTLAWMYGNDEVALEAFLNELHDELLKLDWSSQEQSIRQISGLAVSYMGSSSAYARADHVTNTSDFLKRTGLYADTIVVKDDVLSELASWKRRGTGVTSCFDFVLGHAIDMLALKDLFMADLESPICALGPSAEWSLAKNRLINRYARATVDVEILFASELFGRTFKSINELRRFLGKIQDPNSFFSHMRKPELLVNPFGETASVCADLIKMTGCFEERYGRSIPLSTTFDIMIRNTNTETITDLVCAGRLQTELATDMVGTWNLLTWLLRRNCMDIFEKLGDAVKYKISADSLIVNALQQDDLKWLGNVPIDKLCELRQRGEMSELRDIISRNVREIENASDEDFSSVGKNVRYNIEQALKNHQSEVKDLKEKFRVKYMMDTTEIAVTGTLAIVSALFPPAALALGITSGIVGGSSIVGTINDLIEKRSGIRELQRKPTAILFETKSIMKS